MTETARDRALARLTVSLPEAAGILGYTPRRARHALAQLLGAPATQDHVARPQAGGDAEMLDDHALLALAVALRLGDLGVTAALSSEAGMRFAFSSDAPGFWRGDAPPPVVRRMPARCYAAGRTVVLAGGALARVVNSDSPAQWGDALDAFRADAAADLAQRDPDPRLAGPLAPAFGDVAVAVLDVTGWPDLVLDRAREVLPRMRARNTRLRADMPELE